MAVGYSPRDDQVTTIWEYPGVDIAVEPDNPLPIRVDALAIALLILAIFLAIQLLSDRNRGEQELIEESKVTDQIDSGSVRQATGPEASQAVPENAAPAAPMIDASTIIYPYDEYWVTQGPHGMSYGHMAIDLAAGKGTAIKSPIQGTVSANYVDVYGNTTLVLENERYTVTMLHGDYPLAIGQPVALGEAVGTESNHGYTTDMYGNYCGGRDCGHHTHLNIFDKSIGQNVNPLDVLAQ